MLEKFIFMPSKFLYTSESWLGTDIFSLSKGQCWSQCAIMPVYMKDVIHSFDVLVSITAYDNLLMFSTSFVCHLPLMALLMQTVTTALLLYLGTQKQSPTLWSISGPRFTKKTLSCGYVNPHHKPKTVWYYDCLRFILGIPMLIRQCLLSE